MVGFYIHDSMWLDFIAKFYNLLVLMIYILLENPSSLGGHNIEYNDYNDLA